MGARQQTGLAELTRSMLAGTTLTRLMEQGLALVAHTVGVAQSAVWELLPEQGVLELRANHGWANAAAKHTPLRVAVSSAFGAALLSSPALRVSDWPGEASLQQPQFLRDGGVASSFAVVIPGPHSAFGSLSVDDTVSRRLSRSEIHFLEQVATIFGLAIERDHATQEAEQERARPRNAVIQRLIVLAQEQAVREERQRIARDLHDSVIQALYSVTLHVHGARLLLGSGDVPLASEALRGLQETAQGALDELRLLIFDLRPPLLDQVGLVAAIQARLTAVEGRTNLQARLIADEVGDLPAFVEQELYRIAQEALNNALKHSRARHITLWLRREERRLVLEIVDDGVGFEPTSAGDEGGAGLRGITERVAGLGGAFALQSAPAAGTRLRVEVPL